MPTILGIKFIPLGIPLKKRLEIFAVLKFVATFLIGGFGCLAFCIYLLSTRFYFIPPLYFLWYVWDRNTPVRGGRRWTWVRTWALWRYCADYFPMTLHKTVDLDPRKNYLIAYHPHGILGLGGFVNFSTYGTRVNELFPGIRTSLLILKGHFDFPFYRDYLMLIGLCAVTKQSLAWLLSKEGSGNAPTVIIGGALEALEGHPGTYRLNLKEKKGFVKIAMRNGADLVPTFSFGENDLYTQVSNPPGSFLRNLQTRLMKFTGFSPPIFNGCGIIQESFGLLPYRRKVDTVVGAPIPVVKTPQPTQEQVDTLHKLYIEKLEELFEQNKKRFGVDDDVHITYL